MNGIHLYFVNKHLLVRYWDFKVRKDTTVAKRKEKSYSASRSPYYADHSNLKSPRGNLYLFKLII